MIAFLQLYKCVDFNRLKMEESLTKRRQLNPEEKEAAFNILALLPRDVVVHLLKTTNLSIADVLHFCELNVWSFNLCSDKKIWKQIYEQRFKDRELRTLAEKSLHRVVWLDDPETQLTIQLEFTPISIQLVNIINNTFNIVNFYVRAQHAHDRAVAVISNIYGPVTPPLNSNDTRTMWVQRFQDTLTLASIFRKMVLYTFYEHKYRYRQSSGGTKGIGCLVCNDTNVNTACNACHGSICGSACFEKHYCSTQKMLPNNTLQQ
jgi:hypothetical protein